MTAHIGPPHVNPTFKRLEATFFQFLSKSASFVVVVMARPLSKSGRISRLRRVNALIKS